MFIKHIVPHNNTEILIQKERINFIENMSTATNYNRTILTLKIYFDKDDSMNLNFNTQHELDSFLHQIIK